MSIYLSPEIDFHFPFQPTNLGCLAKSNIPKGTLLARIPFSECIEAETEEEMIDLIRHVYHTTDHKMHAYVAKVIESGSLSPILSVWEKQKDKKTSISNIMKCMNIENPIISAYMLSRCFAKENGQIVSVPFGDMFNHSTSRWATCIREDVDSFRFFAESEIFKGDQIFNNYGKSFDAMTMYVTHGFYDLNMSMEHIYILMSWLTSDTARVEDEILIKIDTNELIPESLLKALPLKEHVMRLVDLLLIALNKFEPQIDDIIFQNETKLVSIYREKLIQYKEK